MKSFYFPVLILAAVFALASTTSWAADYYVNPDGVCGGSSPCYTTIQAAIDASSAGETIEVQDGVYDEVLTIATQNLTIQAASGETPEIKSTTNLSGSYEGIVTIAASGVTLDGLDISSDVSAGYAEKRVGVRVEEAYATIQNCKIHHVSWWDEEWGDWDGILIWGGEQFESDHDPTGLQVLNCELYSARGSEKGIGVQPCHNAYPHIDDVVIRGNIFYDVTRGIYGNDKQLYNITIEQNVFCGYRTLEGTDGWAAYAIGMKGGNYSNSGVIRNNLIYGWKGYDPYTIRVGSTGVASSLSEIDIINNTIVDNGFSDTVDGGAILIEELEYAGKIKNNIIANNGSYGISSPNGAVTQPGFEVDYNDLYNNGDGNYNNVTAGTNDISRDPDFVSTTSPFDYHLESTSPCIDTGTDTDAPTEDLEENPRPVDGDGDGTPTTDMGAYEKPGDSTSIELITFEAEAMDEAVILAWETASEPENAGFALWRSTTENGGYARITPSLIPAEGDATHGAVYGHTDADVDPGETYYYKLEDIDIHGQSTFHGPVHVTITESLFGCGMTADTGGSASVFAFLFAAAFAASGARRLSRKRRPYRRPEVRTLSGDEVLKKLGPAQTCSPTPAQCPTSD